MPRDIVGMLIHPIRTLRKSKYTPLPMIVFWFGALVAINALVLGATTYYSLKGTDFEENVGLSVFWFGTNIVFGEIAAFVLIIGLAVAIVHGVSRILGRNSTLPMALRVVLYGATPVFLFTWTFWLGPTLIHTILGIEILEAAILTGCANLLFLIWAIILIGIGFRELHGMATEETNNLSHTEVN